MKFGTTVCRDPEQIVSGWGNYFKDLYTDTERPHYDSNFQREVDTRVKFIKEEIENERDANPTYISMLEVKEAIKELKKKKACGADCIYNEHLIYGGDLLYEKLANFYTAMFNYGYIPCSMKEGIIITLHKGGKKSKTDPNNYRAITLSSAILKLFEKLLLEKVKAAITKPLNCLQGGFRPQVGCNMSSLMIKECISYAKENHSKLFVCYLDIQKAFDRMWHNGLFVKLYDLGIRSKLLGIIIDLHTNMKSCVLYKGHKSIYFHILQGSRQGGVLSPFMFSCYNDDLLEQLTKCNVGFKMLTMNVCSPTVADDMVLLALSVAGLLCLLCICYAYSCKWRYEYSALKSSVIVYNETKYNYMKSKRVWRFGNDIIKENENYKHLGIINNKYLSKKLNIKDVTDKLKGTYFSLANSGILLQETLHPLTCITIYKSVVLPKALYGCEYINNITESEMVTLERSHRFCIKRMQSLGMQTRTDAALSLMGIFPLETEIDFRKLTLFGQFCRTITCTWVKRVFLFRLLSYMTYPYNGQHGFIPDVIKLLEKYQMLHIVHSFVDTSRFPSKNAWNRLLKGRLHQSAICSWNSRTLAQEFYRFRIVHPEFQPHWAWYFSKNQRKLLSPCTSVIQMTASLTDTRHNILCAACDSYYDNIADHCIHECSYLTIDRTKLWQDIRNTSTAAFEFLLSQNMLLVSNVLLGMANAQLNNILNDKLDNFKRVCVLNLHKLWQKYKSATSSMLSLGRC